NARAQAGDQRRNSKAALAIDIIAAHPVISASTLAARLSVSVQAACVLLERFGERGLVVDVTRRSARRLFALKDLAPLRDTVQPRAQVMSGRRRGRPRASADTDDSSIEGKGTVHDFMPVEQWAPDYSELEAAITEIDCLMTKICL
ncbi:hypothetical protein J2D75_13775, partial [Acetobacter suratthaniensis]|nr:hypothetical protein [Acetobacter suratthaniensis]